LCPDGNMHGIIGLYRHIGRTGLGWIDGQKSPVFRRGKSGNPSRSCRRGTSSTRYVKHIVLDTKVSLSVISWRLSSVERSRQHLRSGFVSCKKKNRNAKNMASAGARAYMGSGGGAPRGVQGQSPWSVNQ